ncbi:2'-deoxycytidine 5'-triphosphate deaminase [soil metagenome]
MDTVADLAAGDRTGILPSHWLRQAAEEGVINSGDMRILPGDIQPGSLDLRLGEVAYRVRCSFLPDDGPVEEKLKELTVAEIDLRRDGAVLEPKCPYIVPLIERLRLPDGMSGKANPKSSTGRLDVFTRVITDRSYRFDEIEAGYEGPLYLEIVPLSFTVRVKEKLTLAQLRLSLGKAELTDEELRDLHAKSGLLYRAGRPVSDEYLATANGLFLGLDLAGDSEGRVGYRARKHAPPVDASTVRNYEVGEFWDIVTKGPGDRIILDPESFYLLMSEERIRIPDDYAAEMTAYDPTSGELRTHYAGFFDPGFGNEEGPLGLGSRAALEVRAHDVPFMVEHGQRVCKLTFSRMLEAPATAYGAAVASHYQHQEDALSKHFLPPEWLRTGPDPLGRIDRPHDIGARDDQSPKLFDHS